MRRKIRALIAALLCGATAFALCFSVLPIRADAVSQAQIDALKAQRDAISAQRQEKQAVVDQLEADKAGVVETKKAMDERNVYTIQQIQLNSDEIAVYDDMIKEKAKEVDAAQALEDQQLARYRARVRAMEENGDLNYLALILKANDLGEMLTTIDDVGEIMESDKALERAYVAAREHTEEIKASYEETRADISAKQEVLRAEQVELEKDIQEATDLIANLELDIENRQAEYDAIMAAETEANAVIDQMVAELEAQRKAAAAAGASAAGTGSFLWPVASYTYVSSRFGLRVHPITGVKKSHTGMDIASASGTTVYAADGGTVSLASWNGGYGNCIMIDHGNGYVTLYGHLSAISVSKGATVSRGDAIGAVGSTGNSTGPHLHFEVIKEGSRIDPEQFFSGLTISPDAGV